MKLLLADDDEVSRIVLRGFLGALGDVSVAHDADEAWVRLQEARFDVCCSDVRMPGGGGIDLLRRVRADAVLADLPFVLITSAADRDTVASAKELGVSGYLLKPLAAMPVRAAINRLASVVNARRSEPPMQTRLRLNLEGGQLRGLFDALAQDAERLLAQAGADIDAELARLHTACLTLGLWGPAAQLARVTDAAAAPARPAVLRAVAAGVREQEALLAPI